MKEIDIAGITQIVNNKFHYCFSVEFVMSDGREFSTYIWAKNWDEANEMVKAIKMTARIGGQITGIFPSATE